MIYAVWQRKGIKYRARREGERRRMGVRENMLGACSAFSESHWLSSAKLGAWRVSLCVRVRRVSAARCGARCPSGLRCRWRPWRSPSRAAMRPWPVMTKKSGSTFRVGVVLDFVSSSARTAGPRGAYVQVSGRNQRRNRADPRWGRIEHANSRGVRCTRCWTL